jgi:hypothetical protein
MMAVGLALLGTLAIGAMLASTASAAGEKFHTSVENTIIEPAAINTQEFETSIGTVKCKKMEPLVGVIGVKTNSELKFTPRYVECEAVIGGKSVTLHYTPTSCDFYLTAERTGEHARYPIKCMLAFDTMDFNVTILGIEKECLKFPAQTPPGAGLTYTNKNRNSGTGYIAVKPTVTEIEYTVVGSCGNQTKKNGVYRGEFSLKVLEEFGNPVEIWWE